MTDNAPVKPDPPKDSSCAPNDAPKEPPGGKKKCPDLPKAPDPPKVPTRDPCPQPCNCPTLPGGPASSCLDELIKCQSKVVKKADRAKAFVEELTAIQGKVTSAQMDYTQARYKDLLKLWQDQDEALVDLVEKVTCAVHCWECLLECRLCPQLTEIRRLEERLYGKGDLTKDVYSLLDLQAWHQRNVAQMQARVERITSVLSAWEKPSATLGDVLEKNGKLIEDTQKIVATDSAKALYDVFMTLLPRHWAIGSPDARHDSKLDKQYIQICECDAGQTGCKCDEGSPDECCGPDVGILNLRQRLVGPLPYIVDPALLPVIICCLTTERLSPASDQLATAQADLAATTDEVEQVKKLIDSKTGAIEATFRAELVNPIDCKQYTKKTPQPPPAESRTDETHQTDQTAR